MFRVTENLFESGQQFPDTVKSIRRSSKKVYLNEESRGEASFSRSPWHLLVRNEKPASPASGSITFSSHEKKKKRIKNGTAVPVIFINPLCLL
jgi:hypothetical protein